MRNYLKIVPIMFFVGSVYGQEKNMETVYFEFAKHSLQNQQEQIILDFIKKIDTSKIESIQIYGYCDDRGNNNYNYTLSENRVRTVQNLLVEKGFNKNKIVIIEGKGRVLLTNNESENLSKIRSKNRRVDLLIINKNSFGKGIYNSFQEAHTVGDHIYWENILFALGSSKLTYSSKKELDKIAVLLDKNKEIEFEIRGHVCCTPNYYRDAIDKETNERKLSQNRAKSVLQYLTSRGINRLRMTYKGCGNKFPLGQGEALDRRVEFVITKT